MWTNCNQIKRNTCKPITAEVSCKLDFFVKTKSRNGLSFNDKKFSDGKKVFSIPFWRFLNFTTILWKTASKNAGGVQVSRHKKIENIASNVKRGGQPLFASAFPISEYMDNISRIGQVIMNKRLDCHDSCTKRKCEHPFAVNLSKQPTSQMKCTQNRFVCSFRNTWKLFELK